MKLPNGLLAKIQDLVARGALFVVSNSGGKDSQAMLIVIRSLVPASQILVIHAELPGVEWEGTLEHARLISEGLEFRVAVATKTFLDMVDRRQNWPSPKFRQCTSDLKRGPIERVIKGYLKETRHSGLVVSCMGLRAQESGNRKCGLDKTAYKATGEAAAIRFNKRCSKAGREWYDMVPILNYTVEDVWATIKDAGQTPHWAYSVGMSRLSCCFCIMANKADLATSAKHNPELYAKMVAKEKEIGKTMFAKSKKVDGVKVTQPISLEDYTGVKVGA